MVFNSFELPHVGGPGLQAQRVSTRLRQRGHEVIFVAKGQRQGNVREIVAGIPLYRVPSGLASLLLGRRLWQLRQQYDIIHVHGVGDLAADAVAFGRRYHKPVFVKVTTAGHIKKKQPPGLRGLIKSLDPRPRRRLARLKQSDGMIAISREIMQELQQLDFPPEKILYIPNGVDTATFRPADGDEKIALRRKLGLPMDKTIFLYTGKLTTRKGIDTLLKAWQASAILQCQALLLLIGSGEGQPDSLERELPALIAGCGGSVRRLGITENTAAYLRAGDAFALPSWREGLSNSLLEAMSTGLVCIASAIGGNVDLIAPGRTGMLVPPGDVNAWRQALEEALRCHSAEVAAAAASFVRRRYSLDATTDSLERVYLQALAGEGPR